jgi:hypothetical protein
MNTAAHQNTDQIICIPAEEMNARLYYAVQNLYLRCGLILPSIGRMQEMRGAACAGDLVFLLSDLGFPGLVCAGVIPNAASARDVLTALMRDGWHLLLGFGVESSVTDKAAQMIGDAEKARRIFHDGHPVAPVSFDDNSLFVIVGWTPLPVCMIPWEADGNLRGIARDFLMVKPVEFEPKTVKGVM